MIANCASWKDMPVKLTPLSCSALSPLAASTAEDFPSGGSDGLEALVFAFRAGVADVRPFAPCPSVAPLIFFSPGLGMGVGKLA
jgi:hypothetical protein